MTEGTFDRSFKTGPTEIERGLHPTDAFPHKPVKCANQRGPPLLGT